MTTVITNIIEAIVSAFNGLLEGVGNGVVSLFEGLFVTTATDGTITGLTTFAAVSFVMVGIALAIGIVQWIIHKVG